MSRHVCAVPGCDKDVAPAYLMCAEDWKLVPGTIRRRLVGHWSTGQDRHPEMASEGYRKAALAAVTSVVRQRAGLGPGAIAGPPTSSVPMADGDGGLPAGTTDRGGTNRDYGDEDPADPWNDEDEGDLEPWKRARP